MEKRNLKNSKFKQKKIVWEFTNKRKLTATEFLRYFEKKVWKTIRQFGILPKDKIFLIKESDDLNVNVLKHILGKKFEVRFSGKPNISSEDLSDIAEKIFKSVLDGNFKKKDLLPVNPGKPLYFLLREEVELYARLVGIKGKKQKSEEKVRKLFDKFKKRNPDLEHNVVNAFLGLFQDFV